jgi:hypothetical protein
MLSLLAIAFAVSCAAQAPTWPPIDDAIAATGGGENDAAVVVGVSNYYKLPKIDGAADNASAWAQYLMQVRKVPSSRVVTLRDDDATRERILSSARTMASQVKPGGTLWFVFIGHGAPAQSGNDGLLLGADTQPDGESLTARGVLQEELLKILASGAQAETLAIFDACFSGKSSDGEASLVAGLQATLPNRRVASAAQKRATILASSDTWAGPLPGTGRPAFSFLLLGALRGWGDDNGDKKVGLQEAFDFTKDTMQGVMKTANRLPSMRGQTSARLLVPARAARPDIASLVAGRCPSGSSWVGAQCKEAPRVECPAGTSWNGSACVSLCPAGTAWNGRACAATVVECPAGTTWNGSACQAQQLAATSQPDSPAAPTPSTSPLVSVGIDWVRSQGILIAKTETTVAQYRACVNAGICSEPNSDGSWSSVPHHLLDDNPVSSVDWRQATLFCRWAGGRLPTPDEWQRVASNGGSTAYPWGDAKPDRSRANYVGADTSMMTSPGCSFPTGSNNDGVCDLAGNVWEWTASDSASKEKEIRGGSWNSTAVLLSASFRRWNVPQERFNYLGFRCAQ